MLSGKISNLRKLEEDLRPDSAADLTELRNRLGATYTHVCEHFRLEDLDPYMDEIRKRQPEFDRHAQRLVEEHRELRQSLDALHGEAALATTLDEAFREKVRKWITRVQQHEARENALVQNTFGGNWRPKIRSSRNREIRKIQVGHNAKTRSGFFSAAKEYE